MLCNRPVPDAIRTARSSAHLTLLADTFPGVKTSAAPMAAAQTFGALSGSRHVELQAKPCVFSSDCIFYDEVHVSVITVHGAAWRWRSCI